MSSKRLIRSRGQQLAPGGVAFLRLRTATSLDVVEQAVQGVELRAHGVTVAGEFRRTRVDPGVQNGHGASGAVSGFR
jgi:hypothetical protein